MTTNKYATLRGTLARAKRHDCQKVVMRVTLAEELLEQLSKAEERIAELEAILACDRCGTICTRPDGFIIATLATTPTRATAPSELKAKN
ncbi:hypothetical protein [Enterobacter bugandensis]|uniref:hypothetical protein n=1 Tax=Enterobacter bugandensis TaxID=881260 RepID=UPI003076623D